MGLSTRALMVMGLVIAATSANACARRYASGLLPGVPRHTVDAVAAPTTQEQTPTPPGDQPLAPAQKPSPRVARSRPATHSAAPDPSVGTTGSAAIDAAPPAAPSITVTNTPSTRIPPPATSRLTIVTRTLRRSAATAPVGGALAVSTLVSIALYRRRHRV
jgi:hypothetical protein